MKKFKKGFTLIELLVVIAIVGILATTLPPKLFLNLRKGTMATVQHNLGVIRSRLSIDHLNDQYPDLVNGDATLLSAYTIEDTPIFTDENDVTYQPTNRVVDQRDDKGGWVYYRETGQIYANLPNGAYTKLPEFEIWTPDLPGLTDYTGSGNISLDVGESKQIDTPTNPVPPTAEFPGPVYTLKNSSDSSIATVTDSGVVTGVSQGDIIVLQTVSPLVAEITVSVTAPPVSFLDDTDEIIEGENSVVNQIVSGDVTANDSTQVGPANFTVTSYSENGTYGTFTINSNGMYSYELDGSNTTVNALVDLQTLEENFNIDVTENNSGESKTTVLKITIRGVNDNPVVSSSLSISTNEDVELTLTQNDLLVNTSDPENEGVFALNVEAGDGNATVTDNLDGTYTITPILNFNGNTYFTFDISDMTNTISSSIDLTVLSVNDLPVAIDDSGLTTDVNTSLVITPETLLPNDSDVDGDSLSITSVVATANTHGTVEMIDEKEVTFDGSSNYMEVESLASDLVGANSVTIDTTFSTTANTGGDWNNSLIAITGTNGSANLIRLGIADDGSIFVNDRPSGITIGDGYNDGQEHTLSVTFTDGGRPTIIADGVTLDTSSLTTQSIDITSGCRTTIGGDWDNDNMSDYFDGNISSMKISNGNTVVANYEMRGDNVLEDTSGNGHEAVVSGTLTENTTSTNIEFTPDTGYTGNASFEYTISDGQGGSATATVDLVVGD